MRVLGAPGQLGAGVADAAPGGRAGWAGVMAGVRATEAYDRGGLPGWAIRVLRAGVAGGGGMASGTGVGSRGSVGASGTCGGPRLGWRSSGGMGVGSLSGGLGASGSGKNGSGGTSLVWRGVYRRRKRRFLVVRRPDPSVLTEYWWYCRTSTTVPVLSHLVG